MAREKQGTPVLINLASLASYDGMTDDPMQVITTGTLTRNGEGYLLKYMEAQEDEATGQVMETEIHLALQKDQVTMIRVGDFESTMMFKQNRTFETVYHTPYGDLPMAIFPRDVKCDLGREAGKVHLKYELSMQGAYASTNELHLEYWKQ